MSYYKDWHHLKVFSMTLGCLLYVIGTKQAQANQCPIPEPKPPLRKTADQLEETFTNATYFAPETLKQTQINLPEAYSATKRSIETTDLKTIELSEVEASSISWLEQGKEIALSSGQVVFDLVLIGDWIYNIKQAFQSDSATTYDKVEAVGSLFDVLGFLKVSQELGDDAILVKKWKSFSSTQTYHYNLKNNQAAHEQQALKEAYFFDFDQLKKEAELWAKNVAYNVFLDTQTKLLNNMLLQQQLVYKVHAALDQNLFKSLSYQFAHHSSKKFPLYGDLKRFCSQERHQLEQSPAISSYRRLASCQKSLLTHYVKPLLKFFNPHSQTNLFKTRSLFSQRLYDRAEIIQLAQNNMLQYQQKLFALQSSKVTKSFLMQ